MQPKAESRFTNRPVRDVYKRQGQTKGPAAFGQTKLYSVLLLSGALPARRDFAAKAAGDEMVGDSKQ